jgi:acyl-CoA-binding protein
MYCPPQANASSSILVIRPADDQGFQEVDAMSDLTTRFEGAAEDAKQLSKRPSDQVLLQLYAYYKQATVGDVQGKRPGFLDMAGRFKYDAWAKLQGMDSEEAMQAYVDLVADLKEKE